MSPLELTAPIRILAETKTFVQQLDNFELVFLLIEPFSLTHGDSLGTCRSHLTAGQHDIARRRKVYAPADVNAATIALVKPVQNTGPESLRRVRGVLLSPRPDTTSARSFSTVRMIVEIVDLLEAPTEKRLTRWSPAMLTSPMLAVIYTVGDFTVAQVGTSLFTVGSEPFGTLAYISTLAEAERRGHEMAKTHGVSLWLADVTHPRTFLIASYRRST